MVTEAFAAGRKAVPEIASLLEAGNADFAMRRAERAIPAMAGVLEARLPRLYLDALAAGGRVAAAQLKAARGKAPIRTAKRAIGIAFDRTNPYAVAWAEQHAAELVADVTSQVRAGIRELVKRGLVEGIPPKQLARLIEANVGMTQRQAQAVAALAGKLRQATERPRLVRAGKVPIRVPAGGLDAARIDRELKRYADRLTRQRAVNIARTETIRASNEGQRQLWQQQIAAGNLQQDARHEWLTALDERACQVCTDLDGVVVDLDQEFPGGFYGPPAHPSCRCSTGITNASATPQTGAVPGDVPEEIGPPATVNQPVAVPVASPLKLRPPDVPAAKPPLDPNRTAALYDELYYPNAARAAQLRELRETSTEAVVDVLVRDGHMPAVDKWLAEKIGTMSESERERARYFADVIYRKWGATSGDNSGFSLAVQMAAQQEFRLSGAATAHLRTRASRAVLAEMKKILDGQGAALRAALRAQYEATQAWLKAEGIEEITMFRGHNVVAATGGDRDAAAIRAAVKLQPLSSFSLNRQEAAGFGEVFTVVRVPALKIHSFGYTGLGEISEGEFVVLGGVYDEAVSMGRETGRYRLVEELLRLYGPK